MCGSHVIRRGRTFRLEPAEIDFEAAEVVAAAVPEDVAEEDMVVIYKTEGLLVHCIFGAKAPSIT